jgi:zinc transport system substrate-binding protein
MTKYSHAKGARMSTRRLLGWFLLLLPLSMPLVGCRRAEDVWPDKGKKRVLVSFPPLYCFAKQVAGTDADVRCLLTAQGPHDFHPQAKEVMMVKKADLILINGLELDEWVTTMLGKGSSTKHVIEVAETIPKEQLKPMAEGGEHKDDGHGHKHGEYDPHVWLGPPQAKAMVQTIADQLGEIDPPNKEKYEDRAKEFSKELDKLHAHGKAAFKDKKSRNIIATHDSLQYFADAFGLKVVGTIQQRAGIEADAKKLTGLVKICKDNAVSVIAVEPQYSTGPAAALQNQLEKMGVKVQLVEIDPLETAPAAANHADPEPDYYIKRMYRNIDDLAKALP